MVRRRIRGGVGFWGCLGTSLLLIQLRSNNDNTRAYVLWLPAGGVT